LYLTYEPHSSFVRYDWKECFGESKWSSIIKKFLVFVCLFACPKVSSFFILSYLLDHNVKKFLSISSKYMSQEFLLDIRVFSLKKSSCLHPLSLGFFSPLYPLFESLSEVCKVKEVLSYQGMKWWNSAFNAQSSR
jgi:hypothetical protein